MEFTIGISKPGLRKLAASINRALEQAEDGGDVSTTSLYIAAEGNRGEELILHIGGEDFADAPSGDTYYIREG